MTDKQTTLDVLLPIVRKQSEEIRTIKKAVEDLRSTNAFYQKREGVERERADKLNEALLALKSHVNLEHQSVLWHDNEGRFATLRRQIYVFFKSQFKYWDPIESPDGIYWKDLFQHAQRTQPWCMNVDGATFRRRLNELADKRSKPRLLKWVRPGYYLLNSLSIKQEAKLA